MGALAAAFAAFFAGFWATLVAALAATLTELGASGSSHLTIGGCAPTTSLLSKRTPTTGPGASGSSHLTMGGWAPRFAAPPLPEERTGRGASTPTGAVTVDFFVDLRAGLGATFGVEALAVTLASLPGLKLDFAAALLAAFLAGF